MEECHTLADAGHDKATYAEVLQCMHPSRRAVWDHMITHFKIVAEAEATTKMGPKNIATCFFPVLGADATWKGSMQKLMKFKDSVEFLITNWDVILKTKWITTELLEGSTLERLVELKCVYETSLVQDLDFDLDAKLKELYPAKLTVAAEALWMKVDESGDGFLQKVELTKAILNLES